MILPEDEIKERYYKGEIDLKTAKRQLKNLINGLTLFKKCMKKEGHGNE